MMENTRATVTGMGHRGPGKQKKERTGHPAGQAVLEERFHGLPFSQRESYRPHVSPQ
jgi:hypothetical protein